LEVGDEALSQNFEIVPKPTSEVSVADMKRQFDFITDVNNTVDKAHKSIKKIRKINEQLSAFQTQYKADDRVKELVEKAKNLSEQFSEVEKALYQTKNRSGQDPLNFPIKLTNKLAHLNALVGMDDFPPTAQDIAVKNELTAAINKELSTFDNLVSSEIAAFNAQFNQLNLNYLFVEDED
jgi:1-deoxy-D-xylulose 5-phosphate reductoisomerase